MDGNSNGWLIETDSFGAQRRYRMIGNIKEYEKMVRVDGMEIPESELMAFHARNKAIKEAERLKQIEASKQVLKECPFKANARYSRCVNDRCALYMDGCILGQIGEPTKATAEMSCPFSNKKCVDDCALFRGQGCALTALI